MMVLFHTQAGLTPTTRPLFFLFQRKTRGGVVCGIVTLINAEPP